MLASHGHLNVCFQGIALDEEKGKFLLDFGIYEWDFNRIAQWFTSGFNHEMKSSFH